MEELRLKLANLYDQYQTKIELEEDFTMRIELVGQYIKAEIEAIQSHIKEIIGEDKWQQHRAKGETHCVAKICTACTEDQLRAEQRARAGLEETK